MLLLSTPKILDSWRRHPLHADSHPLLNLLLGSDKGFQHVLDEAKPPLKHPL